MLDAVSTLANSQEHTAEADDLTKLLQRIPKLRETVKSDATAGTRTSE